MEVLIVIGLVVVIAILSSRQYKTDSDELDLAKALKAYAGGLRRRGLTGDEIEYELKVDPNSPLIQHTYAIVSGAFDHDFNIPSREWLVAEHEQNINAVYYKWVAVSDPSPEWPALAEKWLQNVEWDKFSQDGTGPCPDCASRVGQEETADLWNTIGLP